MVGGGGGAGALGGRGVRQNVCLGELGGGERQRTGLKKKTPQHTTSNKQKRKEEEEEEDGGSHLGILCVLGLALALDRAGAAHGVQRKLV